MESMDLLAVRRSRILSCRLEMTKRFNDVRDRLFIQTCWTLLEKQGWAHNWCTPMDPLMWPGKSKTTRSNIHTYSSYVRIRDVALKTCQRRWTIGRSGERGSGISVPVKDTSLVSITPNQAFCMVYNISLLVYMIQWFYFSWYKGIYEYKLINSPFCKRLWFYSLGQNFIHLQGSIWTSLRSTFFDIWNKKYFFFLMNVSFSSVHFVAS